MENRLITEMTNEEFDSIIDTYIEHETQNTGELPAPLFYQTLRDIFSPESVRETVELQGELVGDRLKLYQPVPVSPVVTVHDNEIVVNDIRFVIHIGSPAAQVA